MKQEWPHCDTHEAVRWGGEEVTGAPKLSEKQITHGCIDLARHLGFQAIRLHSGVLRGKHNTFVTLNQTGTPDWICVRPQSPGVMEGFYMEMKKGGKKAEPVQLASHESLQARGFLVVVIDSVDRFREWLGVNFG